MANRRCFLALTRYYSSLSSSNPSLHAVKTRSPFLPQTLTQSLDNLDQSTALAPQLSPISSIPSFQFSTYYRTFCSGQRSNSEEDEAEGETEDEEEGDDDDDDMEEEVPGSKTPEQKENEAAEIGYKVIGSLQKSDRVFKSYESDFAVVQIGSHQFKVSDGDCIYTERLKYCDVNDKLILNKVLRLGSSSQTIIGRPILPDAAVHAVVEEHENGVGTVASPNSQKLCPSYVINMVQHSSHRLMTTAAGESAESVSGETSAPDPSRPPRIKFKRLSKTARHIMQIIDREAVEEVRQQREIPEIRPGYIVQLKVEVPENKRRLSTIKGIVIAMRKAGLNTTFRVRRLVSGVGVESLFHLYSPNIKEIQVLEKKKVRRAKLYYLRDKMNALKK